MAKISLIQKPVDRVGGSAEGAVDLLLNSGTRDIDHLLIIATRKTGGVLQWFHNDLSAKEIVWLMERCKLALLKE